MKKYVFIQLTCISIVTLLTGCNDFLDKNPTDEISSSNFWQSADDVEEALTSNYGFLQGLDYDCWDTPNGGTFSYLVPNFDCMTDNGYGQHDYGNTKEIVEGQLTASTEGYVEGIYEYCYVGIARVNLFLEYLNEYDGSDLSDDEKQVYEAEVRFIRAFYYFQLYSFYGDVPLVLEPLTLETQDVAKSSSDEVLTQVLDDVNYAISNLNAESYEDNAGHVTITAAEALKARVLMYSSYDDSGTPDVDSLQTVCDLCEDIIPYYSLSESFTDLFQTAGQTDNPEIIFSINFLAPDNVPTYGTDQLYGDWVVVSPLRNLLDDFECTDGLPYGTSPLTDSSDQFNNRDPRLAATVFEDYVDWGDDNTHTPSNNMPTGYGLKKFLDPDHTPYGYSTESDQDFVVFRLAEVLLMYAEAKNEISGPVESVYSAINSIRERVDMPDLEEGLSQSEMREKIRHERRVELAFEGLRYYDLKRWRIAGDILPNVTDGILSYVWEDKFYKWPLPQSEIDKSNGVLIQNPDYE